MFLETYACCNDRRYTIITTLKNGPYDRSPANECKVSLFYGSHEGADISVVTIFSCNYASWHAYQ